MNLPFSLLDILERLIPGGIFLGVLLLIPPLHLDGDLIAQSASSNGALTTVLFVAISYALGVLFNLGIGIFPRFEDWIFDLRNNVPFETWGAKGSSLKTAFKKVFGYELDQEGWKLCYGIVDQSGFGIRVDLFSSLNMLCRSMSVCCLLLATIYAVTAICEHAAPYWYITGLMLLTSALFVRGSRRFSLVFAIAIYEAFLTWYWVEQAKRAVETKIANLAPKLARRP